MSYSNFVSIGGNESVWDDLRIVPGAFEFAGVSDPALTTWQPGGSGATFRVYEFASGDEVFFTCQLQHKYKVGTDLKPHVHWTPGDRGNEENGNTVAWKVDYSWASINGVFAPSTTVDLTDTCNGIDDRHEISPSGTVVSADQGISSMLVCRLYRDAGDTWSSAVVGQQPILLEFDFHFEIDTLGSELETSKQ